MNYLPLLFIVIERIYALHQLLSNNAKGGSLSVLFHALLDPKERLTFNKGTIRIGAMGSIAPIAFSESPNYTFRFIINFQEMKNFENNIEYCKSCLMPSSRPRIIFDKEICNACKYKNSRKKQFGTKIQYRFSKICQFPYVKSYFWGYYFA